MSRADEIKAQIVAAFAEAERPAPGRLHASDESEEASTLLEADFADKATWQSLDTDFLNWAPNGYASALNFFSDGAFRYFLPAYLIADLGESRLEVDLVFHLTYGLTNSTAPQFVNPSRYGELTRGSMARDRFAAFTNSEAAAIVAFLEYRYEQDECTSNDIVEALDNFWYQREPISDQR